MGKGMFVDTSICIGCKACQVACKEWNQLDPEPSHFTSDPDTHLLANHFTGDSYDNTEKLSATDWRHVSFIEQFNEQRTGSRWLFSSDSCKHCTDAACLNVCPVRAIERTDLGNVVVRLDKCIGTKDLQFRVSLRCDQVQREDSQIAQMHPLQRPYPQRPWNRMLKGLSDRLHPVR